MPRPPSLVISFQLDVDTDSSYLLKEIREGASVCMITLVYGLLACRPGV